MPKIQNRFELDSGHTFVYFEYNHFGFSHQTSRFDGVSGEINIDFKAKTGSIRIQIDMTSASTGSELFNSHIQGEDFFDSKQYPISTFVSDKIEFEGEKITAIEGVLTIKNVSERITLEIVHFEHGKHPVSSTECCGANAVAVVKRSDFNMGKYTPQISDDVIIKVAIEASKHPD